LCLCNFLSYGETHASVNYGINEFVTFTSLLWSRELARLTFTF
jgi:hypothetical protein